MDYAEHNRRRLCINFFNLFASFHGVFQDRNYSLVNTHYPAGWALCSQSMQEGSLLPYCSESPFSQSSKATRALFLLLPAGRCPTPWKHLSDLYLTIISRHMIKAKIVVINNWYYFSIGTLYYLFYDPHNLYLVFAYLVDFFVFLPGT